jgi:hypothetical protein
LKDDITIGQYDSIPPGAQVLQHVQCPR